MCTRLNIKVYPFHAPVWGNHRWNKTVFFGHNNECGGMRRLWYVYIVNNECGGMRRLWYVYIVNNECGGMRSLWDVYIVNNECGGMRRLWDVYIVTCNVSIRQYTYYQFGVCVYLSTTFILNVLALWMSMILWGVCRRSFWDGKLHLTLN